MKRYILRFRGSGPKPEEDVQRIRLWPNTTVVDDSSSRMILIEAPEDQLPALAAALSDWVATPEEMISLPDPIPRVRKPAKK